VLDWWNVLRRVNGLPQRAARLGEAERIVRARLNVQGTTMGFSTDTSDRLWWLMVSNDVNAVRLVLTLLDAAVWKDELPRIHKLRRVLFEMKPRDAMMKLLDKLAKHPTNSDFLKSLDV